MLCNLSHRTARQVQAGSRNRVGRAPPSALCKHGGEVVGGLNGSSKRNEEESRRLGGRRVHNKQILSQAMPRTSCFAALENPALAGQILADFVRKHRA